MKLISFFTFLFLSMNIYCGAPPQPHYIKVVASERGDHYAKLIPKKDFPKYEGRTEIFEVGLDKDKKLITYNWYSPWLYLSKSCNGLFVVRLGTELYGKKANKDDMAIEIWKFDKLIKRYSTLDIAKRSNNVSYNSLGKYNVFDRYPYRIEPHFYFDGHRERYMPR